MKAVDSCYFLRNNNIFFCACWRCFKMLNKTHNHLHLVFVSFTNRYAIHFNRMVGFLYILLKYIPFSHTINKFSIK